MRDMTQNCVCQFLAFGSVKRVLERDSPEARALFDLGVISSIIFVGIFAIVAARCIPVIT